MLAGTDFYDFILRVLKNYKKLLSDQSYIKAGANFIASNEDAELPLARDDLCVPGTGSIIASVKFASKKEPIVVGKPSPLAFDLIRELSSFHGI